MVNAFKTNQLFTIESMLCFVHLLQESSSLCINFSIKRRKPGIWEREMKFSTTTSTPFQGFMKLNHLVPTFLFSGWQTRDRWSEPSLYRCTCRWDTRSWCCSWRRRWAARSRSSPGRRPPGRSVRGCCCSARTPPALGCPWTNGRSRYASVKDSFRTLAKVSIQFPLLALLPSSS